MPPVTPTKASAVLSRGLTRSHTNIPPFPSTPSPLPRFSWSPITPATPPTPTIPYNPTPVRIPIFSPIRSPFSPLAPFPATPSPPSPIVSPFSSPNSKAPVSPLSKFLVSMRARDQRRGARLGTNLPPKPKTLCPGCDRVKMLLPAKWCGHQVTPSRMKNGLRVVRIPKNFPNDKATLAKKARVAKAKLVATNSTHEKKAKAPIADLPVAKTVTPKRVIVEAKPELSIKSSPLVHTPFKNPDLNDKPLHWSPRMFKPEIDRYNWTWSDWDSPSREIEDVTYQTTDWPIHDPLAALPPHIRKKFEEMKKMEKLLLEQQPESSVTADTVRYEEVDIASSFSSEASTRSKRTHSKHSRSKHNRSTGTRSTQAHSAHTRSDSTSSSEFSSWVDVNSRPWPPHVLQMFNEGEEERKEWAARRRNQPTMSPLSESVSDVYIPLDSPKPLREPSPEPTHSSGLSSLLQLYVESDSDRQRWQAEKEKEKELREMVAKAKETYSHESSFEGSTTHSNSGSFASYNSDVAKQYARSIQQIMQDLRAPSTAAPAPAPAPSPVPTAAASPIHDSPPKSPTTHSDSYGSYNSDVALQYAGSIQQILRDLRAPSAAEPVAEPTPVEPTPAEPTHNDSFESQDAHSNSYGSYNSDVANKYAGSIQQIMRDLRASSAAEPAAAPAPVAAPETTSALPTYDDSFESPDAHSDSYGSYNSNVANQYARSIQQIMQDLRASSTAAPAPAPASASASVSSSPSASGSASSPAPSPSQHFFAKRQLPSAFTLERQRPAEVPSRGSGFGWKSLACVGVAAAAVGAGLAYAWLSFAT
ncbi:uncharacterized protein F4817DRAFT_216539 [Daldinia loculata]|uniref:uncharacterized protein n=1 Tax=Daldinia loculata TaxID=103429 RepID=UPI0020C4BD0B|nr:uncharacterized protein F4817DRAFT_216539 [Daldinia loculata]KAI1651032.1 hypothetical protein F4817DRAFT_216539 [Daldinia loculata]